jgi:apolipoprotein N-acyltransferase
MLFWISTALLLGAFVIVFRWRLRCVDSLGRPRPFPWFSAASLLILACIAFVPWLLHKRLEQRLSDAVSIVTGAPVEVHCQTFGQAFVDAGAELGYVRTGPGGVPERSTLLKRGQCDALSDYVSSDKLAPNRAQVVAVHVLTHEAMHMRGVTAEAEAECLAVQHDAQMAELLGAPPKAARALATTYWQSIYPHGPPTYRSDQCGPGLQLDAHVTTAPWATVAVE